MVDPHQIASARLLRVFLCHSSGDKPIVRNLYQRLKACNVDPWFDEENLLPGQDWEPAIRKAVQTADVVIVCLSRGSISKTGFVQKEIKFALDIADEQPEDCIFLIPLKIEECDIPERLRRWHWVNYFEEDGFSKLIRSLEQRVRSLNHIQSMVQDVVNTTNDFNPETKGRNFSPDLYVELRIKEKEVNEKDCFMVYPVLKNRGKAIAKYTTCVCSLLDQAWEIIESDVWHKGYVNSWQFSTYGFEVLYPDVVHTAGYLKLKLVSPKSSSTPNVFGLKFNIYAENMINKEYTILFDTESLAQQVFGKQK